MAADGTQYLIELSAKFTGGDAAAASVANLGDRMLAAGASAADLERATKAAAEAFDAAGESVKATSAAVTEGEASYAKAEQAALQTARAVEKIGQASAALQGKIQKALDVGDMNKVVALSEKFAELGVRQEDAVTKANAASAALKNEAAALDALKGKASAAVASQDQIKKGMGNLKTATDKAGLAAGSGKLNDIGNALKKLGGPVGEAGAKVTDMAGAFQKMGSALGSLGPYVAAAAAILAIAAAAAAATIAMAKWGVVMADANRTQGLLIDGLAGTAAAGGDLADAIDNVSSIVPMARSELMGLAGDLKKSGVAGDQLAGKLEEAAVKAATLKFGPDFAAQMTSLDFQSKRFGENLQATFGGLKIDKLLDGIATLGGLFDASTASGKTLKFFFETMFQPLIDGAADAIPKIERLFLYAEILALKAYIALKPYQGAIMAVGKALLIGAAVMVGIFAAAIALVVVNISAVVAYIGILVGALTWLSVKFVEAIMSPIDSFNALLAGMGNLVKAFVDIGASMIQGLIKGITGSGSAVVDSLVGVVKGGVDAVTKFLKIGSPSKLMESYGSDTAAGFTGGIDDGSSGAQSAMEAMVAPPAATAAAGAKSGASIVVENMIVNGENAKELALDFIEQITRLLEGDARALGAGEMAHA